MCNVVYLTQCQKIIIKLLYGIFFYRRRINIGLFHVFDFCFLFFSSFFQNDVYAAAFLRTGSESNFILFQYVHTFVRTNVLRDQS